MFSIHNASDLLLLALVDFPSVFYHFRDPISLPMCGKCPEFIETA